MKTDEEKFGKFSLCIYEPLSFLTRCIEEAGKGKLNVNLNYTILIVFIYCYLLSIY